MLRVVAEPATRWALHANRPLLTFLIEAPERGGFLIYVRVGREIAQVHILAQPGTTMPLLRGLQEMAVAQAACLRSQALCDQVPVPASLIPETGPAA